MEMAGYHFYILLYILLDSIIGLYHWATNNKQNQNKKLKKKLKKDLAEFSKFFQYCAQGDKEKLKEVIRYHQHQIDINATQEGSTALHFAINSGHYCIVQVLLANFEHQIDTTIRNESGFSALDLAVIKQNLKIFNLILKHTKKPHFSSLILAVETLQDQMIKPLKAKMSGVQPAVKTEIEVFCDLLKESRKSQLKQNEKDCVMERIDIQKDLIISNLSRK